MGRIRKFYRFFKAKNRTGQSKKKKKKDFQDFIQGYGNQGNRADYNLTETRGQGGFLRARVEGIIVHLCLLIGITEGKREYFHSFISRLLPNVEQGAHGGEAPIFPQELGDQGVIFNDYVSKRWLLGP